MSDVIDLANLDVTGPVDDPSDITSRAACCLATAGHQLSVAKGLPVIDHRYLTWSDKLPPCKHSFIAITSLGIECVFDRAACHTVLYECFQYRVGRCGSPNLLNAPSGSCEHGPLGSCGDCGEVPPMPPSDPDEVCLVDGVETPPTETSHFFWRAREMRAFAVGIENKFCECYVQCTPGGFCSDVQLRGKIVPWEKGGWSGFVAQIRAVIA